MGFLVALVAYDLLRMLFVFHLVRTSFVGCWECVCVVLFQRHAIVLAACILESCAILLLLFVCGVVLAVTALVNFAFIYDLLCFLTWVCVCMS